MMNIQFTEPLIDITMKVEIDLPQSKILEFLTQKGYEVKAYRQIIPATEEMLISEPELVNHTFTATKDNEPQSDENLYLKVFEKEIKKVLKSI